MSAVSTSEQPATERAPWRAVAIPSEHGGWGLTLEPVLLGLVVAFSWSGLAIGSAAFVAFLVRTPLKLAVVDRRRHRSLPRTRLATRIAAVELVVLAALGASALWSAGAEWLIPVLIAVPLVAVELWFDIRSRSRRLVPELAGAVGIAAVAASITVAGDEGWRLAVALWMMLAARAVASIPYVRTQIVRARRGSSPLADDRAVPSGRRSFGVRSGRRRQPRPRGCRRRGCVGAGAIGRHPTRAHSAREGDRTAPDGCGSRRRRRHRRRGARLMRSPTQGSRRGGRPRGLARPHRHDHRFLVVATARRAR